MEPHAPPDLTALAAATIDWWRMAGIDTLTHDDVRDWRAAPPAPVAAPAAPAAVVPAAMPDTLDAFVAWRHGPAAPEAAFGTPVPPAGDAATARLAVVVDWPDDSAHLSCANGALFDRMLAAIGLSRADVYLAALCTAVPPVPRLAPNLAATLAPLLHRHLQLAGLAHVWLLGDAANRAMRGTDGADSASGLRHVDLRPGTVAAIAGRHPRTLIERPALKAGAWRDLLCIQGELRRCAP